MAGKYWVWVTTPECYAETDGSDRRDLDPGHEPSEGEGWWTCHEDTQPGDLVLLYRTGPRSDLAYLFEARSAARTLQRPPMMEEEKLWELLDRRAEESAEVAAALETLRIRSTRLTAYEMSVMAGTRREGDCTDVVGSDEPIDHDTEADAIEAERLHLAGLSPDTVLYSTDEGFLEAMGWEMDPAYVAAMSFVGEDVCSWAPLQAFEHPLTLSDMRADPHLADWGALRASFQGTVFRIPEGIWQRLVELLDQSNPGFARFITERTPRQASTAARIEKDLEDRLALDPTLITSGLRLYTDPSGRSGKQYWAEGIGRRGAFIDLLCLDSRGDLVVVELKAQRASEGAVAQTGMYIGWVRQHLAQTGQAVRGIVVAPDHDERFRYARESRDDIGYVDAVPIARRLGLQW